METFLISVLVISIVVFLVAWVVAITGRGDWK